MSHLKPASPSHREKSDDLEPLCRKDQQDLPSQADVEEEEEPRCCWVCLGDSSGEGEPPVRSLCRCPSRFAHDACLGRWQLQQAGKRCAMGLVCFSAGPRLFGSIDLSCPLISRVNLTFISPVSHALPCPLLSPPPSSEERRCRFCSTQLPDSPLTCSPPTLTARSGSAASAPLSCLTTARRSARGCLRPQTAPSPPFTTRARCTRCR